MRVFRVETTIGEGPYRHAGVGSELCKRHCGNAHHPGPFDDRNVEGDRLINFLWQDRSFVFGFASLEQLLAWFVEELELLAQHEFVVSVYESSQVVYGKFQVIFIKESPSVETIKL